MTSPPPYSTIPQLPPRTGTIHLTPNYSPAPPSSAQDGKDGANHPYMDSWASQDPRSSSTQSLLPPEDSENDFRRRLLLIFVHGFHGNETSFRSFPAHLHNLVTVTLAETHTVHTKIYPRYRSRKRIENAAEDLSRWFVFF
jgi:hypothetical protein